jgi:DNA-binding transcriptional ArsR family regulator
MQLFGCVIVASMDAVFKALADPSRRKLLDELRKENGQTLSELCEHLYMTRQAVTKHLVLLEKAKLVAVVWRGREKLHYLNPMPLHEICERWIGKYERHRLQALSEGQDAQGEFQIAGASEPLRLQTHAKHKSITLKKENWRSPRPSTRHRQKPKRIFSKRTQHAQLP